MRRNPAWPVHPSRTQLAFCFLGDLGMNSKPYGVRRVLKVHSQGTGEMVLWTKCLPCKNEDLTLHPKHPRKKMLSVLLGCKPIAVCICGKTERGRSLGTSLLVSSSFNERPCLRN